MTLAAEFIRQNNWANETLIEFCRGLDESLLDASVPGTYGKVRDTLVHMIGSLDRYLARLKQAGPAEWQSDMPWPGFDRLSEAAARFGAGLEEFADQMAEDAEMLTLFPDGRQWRIRSSALLVQAVNHCTDHRSQIATILTQAGVEPPGLDGWTWAESTARLGPV